MTLKRWNETSVSLCDDHCEVHPCKACAELDVLFYEAFGNKKVFTDTERLNWMIKNSVEEIPATGGGIYLVYKNPFNPTRYFCTVREAIDEAMKQEKKA